MKIIQILILVFISISIALFIVIGVGGQNHYDFHPRVWGYGSILGSISLYLTLKVIKRSTSLSLMILVLGVFLGGILITFDHFNIIVNYEEWAKRGMPVSPFK